MSQSNRVSGALLRGLRRVTLASTVFYGWLGIGLAVYAYQRQLWYLFVPAMMMPIIQTMMVEYIDG
jgi:predicted metal-binding membrane protein